MNLSDFAIWATFIQIQNKEDWSEKLKRWKGYLLKNQSNLIFANRILHFRREISRYIKHRRFAFVSLDIAILYKYATFLLRYPYNTVTSLRSSVLKMPAHDIGECNESLCFADKILQQKLQQKKIEHSTILR